ncbi:MAG: right-handed parallel beta-helix repeat-containing protein [bacterium]|nr:right-handed parallel beta-helix repeat-containing protein [bacterium]
MCLQNTKPLWNNLLIHWFGLAILLFFVSNHVVAKTHFLQTEHSLQQILQFVQPNDTIRLSKGEWKLIPSEWVDSLCGNCLDAKVMSKTTVGLKITTPLTILGVHWDSTILRMNAGYGIFIHAGGTVHLENLGITGGVRSADGNATDAAIVVRNSEVVIKNCRIFKNNHRIDTLVVGVAGVVGREGSKIVMEQCTIEETSWDGIALYRGASLIAKDLLIQQGRGAGIGITWDANAWIERVTVRSFWKGIGTFGNSVATVKNSVIRENLGWGLIATGTSTLVAENNAIVKNGNCGVGVWSDSCTMKLSNNLIGENGWKTQWVCPCVGLWRVGRGTVHLRYNLFWLNDSGATKDVDWDITQDDAVPDSIPNWVQVGNRILLESPLDEQNNPKPDQWEWLKNGGDPMLVNRDGTRSGYGPWFGSSAPTP